jgi:hypothetical protein
MSTILETAVFSIQVWNEVRNNGFATRNYFNQGAYFQISRESFNQWNSLNPIPESIHAYMGLVQEAGQADFSLALFSVDNITDSKEVSSHEDDYNANLKSSIYKPSILPNAHFIFEHNPPAPVEPQMDTLEALKASNQWVLYKDSWLLEQENFVQVFEIPFEDLIVLFDNEAVDNIVALPALRDLGGNNFEMHLILWGSTEEGLLANYPMDLIRPCPPFKKSSNFQLLTYALGS